MTIAHRFVSLSILGATALALAPIASAQGLGGDIDRTTRQEIRAELETCKAENEGDHDAMKACAEAVMEQYGIERPERPDRRRFGRRRMGHKFRSNITETCGERENTAQWKACAKDARGGVREQLKTCLELDDVSQLKECVRGVRDSIREQLED